MDILGWVFIGLVALGAVCAVAAVVVTTRKLERTALRLAKARSLLGDALAAEQSAVSCREVGAFDQAQRDEILLFLRETEARPLPHL